MAEQEPVQPVQDVELERDLVEKFSCPTCEKFIYPPIGQCRKGHAFCPKCFDRMNRCLFCLSVKSKSRCTVLEKLNNLLKFPCKFADKGCTFTTKSSMIVEHEIQCEHSVSLCPLKFNDCQWTGRRSLLVSHCLKNHPMNIYFTSSQQLLVRKFNDLQDRKYFILFNVFDCWFRFIWSLDSNTGTMLFAMYHIGRKPTQVKFRYEVKFVHPSQHGNRVVLRDSCHRSEDEYVDLLPNKNVYADYDVMMYYCDGDGDLSYTVSIYRNTVSLQHASGF